MHNRTPTWTSWKNRFSRRRTSISSEFGVNDTTLTVGKSKNELSPKDSHGNASNPSLTIVEQKEEPIDPIDQILEGNQLPIVADAVGESLFKEEDIDFVNEAALPIGKSLNELSQKDNGSHGNDFSVNGEVEKNMRPARTSSRPVRYTESLDESEPVEKKPRIKSAKKIDNKKGSDVDESSSKQSTEGARITKMNHVELECPKCKYRSLSVPAWYVHLHLKHSTSPRELSLALVCECGIETFSERHSLQCDISKITIVRKNATPQCVMCEIHPKTVCGYARHLQDHHKTNLKQMGFILICACGIEVRSNHVDPKHTKKCNGHEYTLHKLYEE